MCEHHAEPATALLSRDGLPVREHFAEPAGLHVIDEPPDRDVLEIHGCDLAF